MKEILAMFFVFVSFTIYSQDFLDKKVTEIDYSKDIEKLYENGLNQLDIKFLGFLLVENLNKKNQIDSITIRSYISKLNDFRLTDDYQMIKSIQNKAADTNYDFADSLKILNDFNKAIDKSQQSEKPLLVVFVGNNSLNSRSLKNVIISGVLDKYISNYIIAWLIVDGRDENSKKHLALEMNKFKTDIIPYSVIVKNDKTIRYYKGFSQSMVNEYIRFLKNK